MDLRQVDLNLMVAFEALMEARSVSGAALRLGISQPAMSGALARLRALFDDALFVRSAQMMLPTARAVQLENQITLGLAQFRAALEPPTAFEPATSRRAFSVSGGDYATMVILPRLTAHLARTAPFVDLRFRFVEKDAIVPLLDADELDLALGVFPRVPKRLRLQPLFAERFICIARRGHPGLQHGMTLDNFVKLPHVLVTERGDATGVVDEALATLGLERHIKLTVPHVLVIPSILPDSDMVASVGARAGQMFARNAPLETYELPFTIAAWNLSMLWSRQKAGDLGLAWLRKTLVKIGAHI